MGKYYLGIDEGVSSIGFALTDENFNVIKKSGKSLWGVHLFESAKTEEERRQKRSNARRIDRKKQRISILQNLFTDEINKVDPNFFRKLDSSYCCFEDRELGNKYNLFNEESFSDKDYYNEFPSIYHLRKKLIESNQKYDIRLIYLAIHHIIKNRGHFTMEGSLSSSQNDFLYLFNKLNSIIEKYELSFPLDHTLNSNINKVIMKTKGSKSLCEKLFELFGINNNSDLSYYIKVISGYKIKANKMFGEEIDKAVEIDFKVEDYEKQYDFLSMALGDDIEIINVCKEIYDLIILRRLLGNDSYLSFSMVKRYEKHKDDLELLKKYVKTNYKSKYKAIFSDPNQKNNYPAYIGSNISNNKKTTSSHCSIDDFYSYLKSELNMINSTDKYINTILEDMEMNNFLPKLRTTENGVLPYQLNEIELDKIIENQSKYYSFLNNTYTCKGAEINKIKSILLYKIPYYVGPLNNKSDFAWVARTNEKIYPWNFNEVVDIEKSAENFINKMVNKCTYLKDFNTLPKYSLIYSRYEVLSYLNKININDIPISYDLKEKLLEELFMKDKKVTTKQIVNFLSSQFTENIKVTTAGGKELEEVNCSLTSYITFKEIYQDRFYDETDNIEKIINEITIFEDKDILYNRLINVYNFSTENAKKIKSLSYKKFGSLSKELLTNLKTPISLDDSTVDMSIMDILELTNKNLMEIIYSPEYTFKKQIDDFNIDDEKIDYNYINNYPTSPSNKRAIWNTIKIVDELESIIDDKIDSFFVENTRNPSDKHERSISRKKKLNDIYKSAENVINQFNLISHDEIIEMKELLNIKSEKDLKSKKLYLYFIQMGKSLYTGNPIQFEKLFTSDYDIDHIVPRSLIKDDGIDNLALVEHVVNNNKQDTYPLNNDIVTEKAKDLWKMLSKMGLLSETKKKKLTRKTELSNEEIAAFVSSQLVSTSQVISIVSHLLESRNKNSKVIWSKASNVSDFRNKFNIYKCREANDYHHAKDAYLNVVVGKCVNTKYGTEFNAKKVKEYKDNHWSLQFDKMFVDDNCNAKTINSRNGVPVWNEEIKNIVLNQVQKNDVMVTFKQTKNYGAFYKETIYSPSANKNSLIPRKENSFLSDTTKYGGYLNIEYSHFAVVEDLKKNKKEYKFVGIPILYTKKTYEELLNYLIKTYNLKNPKIVLDNIRKNTVVNINNFEYRIRGESDININVQINWSNEECHYIKEIIKISDLQLSNDFESYSCVNKGKNEEFYNKIIQKFINKPFSNCNMLFSLGYKMLENETTFRNLSLFDQCKLLKNIITIQQCNPVRGDISLIGGSKDAGRISSWSFRNGVKFYAISITGFYKKLIFKI